MVRKSNSPVLIILVSKRKRGREIGIMMISIAVAKCESQMLSAADLHVAGVAWKGISSIKEMDRNTVRATATFWFLISIK